MDFCSSWFSYILLVLTIAVFGGSGDNKGSVGKQWKYLKFTYKKKLHKEVKFYITTIILQSKALMLKKLKLVI
jgi:hypothetical protein